MYKKFETLLEGVFQRYQGGGMLAGDVVKFTDGALSHDWSKKQADNVIEKLKGMMDSDLNLRISAVKAVRPAVQSSVQQDNQVDEFFCDVAQEKAPGLFIDFITVPMDILEPIDTGINLPDVPDSLRYDDKTHIKPEPVEEVKDETVKSQTRKTNDGKNLKDSELSLPEKDTPGKGKKWNDSKPGGGNMPSRSIYTEGYLKDLG